MKKILFLVLAVVFLMCGCAQKSPPDTGTDPDDNQKPQYVNRVVDPILPWSEGEDFSLNEDLFTGFPSFTDELTGEKVYRLTDSSVTDDSRTGYFTYYFRYNCLPAEKGKLLITEKRDGLVRNLLLDLRTGEKKPVTDYGETAELQVKGNDAYFIKGGSEIIKIDLKTLQRSTVYTIPEKYANDGYTISVFCLNADLSVYFMVFASDALSEQKPNIMYTADSQTKSGKEFARFTKMFNHFDFSPVLPDIFFFVRGDSDINSDPSERMYFGDLKRGIFNKIYIEDEYFQGDPFFPNTGTGYTYTHPYWDYEGNYVCDVLWNKQDENGGFRYLVIDFKQTKIDDITDGEWWMSFGQEQEWNIHHVSAGKNYSDWGVGSGGNAGQAVFEDENGKTYTKVNLFHLKKSGNLEYYEVGKVFGDEYSRLGQTSWMLPSGDGALATAGYNHTFGDPEQDASNPMLFVPDVYLYTIPETVQSAMNVK